MRNGFALTLIGICSTLAALAQSGAPGGPPEAVMSEVKDPGRLPGGTYAAAARWQAAGGAAHLTGRAVRDSDAAETRAWEARLGSATPGKHMLYGPYRDMPAGDYVAFVRLKLLDEAGEEKVLELDAVVGFGQAVCATRDVSGSDLALGRYVRVPIAFRCPGGKLEIRLLWTGYGGVRADRVDVFRLDGGKADLQPLRAREAVPSGQPHDLAAAGEKRPYPDVFPRSAKPANTLYVCDLTREPPDVQLCVLVLQGIVNRRRPVLYCLYNETDSTWLNWMRRNKWVSAVKPVPKWLSLLAWFRSRIRGVVVSDPALPASKNVANMLAAVEDCIVVSPRMLKGSRADSPMRGLEVRADMRGRWKTSVEAYRWALENLWPRLNHHLAACSYPDHLGLRDYLTQHRAFIFWISGPIDGARPYADPTAEARVAEELLARMPANCPIMSYPWAAKDVGMGEGPGVTLFAEFGKYLVGSINCTNLSVHSGVKVARLSPRAAPEPRPDGNKVYVSFIMSDGDNLPVLTVSNFPQLWASPARGKVPVGWTVSPAACLLIPGIVSYYYSTATRNDAFLAAVSGVGYTYPDSYGLRYRADLRDSVFDGFLDQTAQYMRQSGLRSIWIMNATQPDRIRRYAERIPDLESLFPDYGRRVSEYRDATYPIARNVGVFHGVTGWTEHATREQKITRMVEEIRSITPAERPAYLHAFIWNWGADLEALPEVMKRLGPGYVAVRPDHLGALFKQDMARRAVLVRPPEHTMAVEGREIAVTVSLQNVSAAPVTLKTAVTSGLRDARATPAEVSLAPGRSTDVLVSGMPDADEIAFLVGGSVPEKRHAAAVRLVPSSELVAGSLPPGRLAFVRRDEGEALAHNSGALMTDTAASGSTAWRADATTASPGYVVFGPYAALPAGRYVAAFRVKGGGMRDGAPVVLDTCVGGGGKITSSRNVGPSELTPNAYSCIPLEFSHPGGTVETRVSWSGAGWIALDWVAVWRVGD